MIEQDILIKLLKAIVTHPEKYCQRSGKETLHADNCIDKAFDVLKIIIEGKRRAGSGRHTVPLEQRLNAVMTGTNGHSVGIEKSANVVRVDFINQKGNDRRLFRCGSNDAQPVNR